MGDDENLFRKAVGPVRPVRGGDQRPAARSAKRGLRSDTRAPFLSGEDVAIRRRSVSDDQQTTPADSFLRPGLQQRTFRQLAGHRFAAEQSLDLHGLTREPARRLLLEFLDECLGAGVTRARIVHGKGQRSEAEQPVLKPLVAASLRQHPAVLAYRPAGPQDGGGATRLLLKRRNSPGTD